MTDWYEPWQPVVGQRVRVRLSGECRMRFQPHLHTPHGSPIGRRLEPHVPETHGRVGTVTDHLPQSGAGHFYAVRFDAPVARADGHVWVGGAFAALELEPVDDR